MSYSVTGTAIKRKLKTLKIGFADAPSFFYQHSYLRPIVLLAIESVHQS
jgi:hypothetical protein